MGNRFSSGKNAIAECDRCGFRYKLTELKREVIKTKNYELLVCPNCWDPDHPQLQLGMFPVDDPQGVMNPRPDRTYYAAGLLNGVPSVGSRDIQWGFSPVGGANSNNGILITSNALVTSTYIGIVTFITGPTINISGLYFVTDSGLGLVTDSGIFLVTG